MLEEKLEAMKARIAAQRGKLVPVNAAVTV